MLRLCRGEKTVGSHCRHRLGLTIWDRFPGLQIRHIGAGKKRGEFTAATGVAVDSHAKRKELHIDP